MHYHIIWLLGTGHNGKRLPAGIDIARTNSLGLPLMKGLTDDINGVFSLQSGQGVLLSVLFFPDHVLK